MRFCSDLELVTMTAAETLQLVQFNKSLNLSAHVTLRSAHVTLLSAHVTNQQITEFDKVADASWGAVNR